jgi:anti-sigma28 factor (negative regulator of flagellin synthesis)
MRIVLLISILIFCILMSSIKMAERFIDITSGQSIGTVYVGTGTSITDSTITTKNMGASKIESDSVETSAMRTSSLTSDKVSTPSMNSNQVCMNGTCIKEEKLNELKEAIENKPKEVKNIIISLPGNDGFTWKHTLPANMIRLRSGDSMEFTLDEKGLRDRKYNAYLRHANFTLRLSPFKEGNVDFQWKFLPQKGVNEYRIFNDYDGGHVVGYDRARDEVLIVKPNDSRATSWVIVPAPLIESRADNKRAEN